MKPGSHPAYADMVIRAFMAMDMNQSPHGHGVLAVRNAVGKAATGKLPDGWERRVMAAVKTLTARKMLVHIPGHTGKLRLSKAALAAAEHHTHVHKAHKPMVKRAPAKGKSPAKRAKMAGGKKPKAMMAGGKKPKAMMAGVKKPKAMMAGVKKPKAMMAGVKKPKAMMAGGKMPKSKHA